MERVLFNERRRGQSIKLPRKQRYHCLQKLTRSVCVSLDTTSDGRLSKLRPRREKNHLRAGRTLPRRHSLPPSTRNSDVFALDEKTYYSLRHELEVLRSNPLNWLLLVGNRLVIASLLTFLFGVTVTCLIATETVAVNTDTSLLYAFQGLVTGNFTLLTIVLSVNQLVLSREFNAPGELENQIRRAIDYRDDVREITGDTSIPTTSSEFLEVLLIGIRESAIELQNVGGKYNEGPLATEIDSVVSDIVTHTDKANTALEEAHTDVFSALTVALEINLSRELRDMREIQLAINGRETPELDEKLESAIEGLKQVDIARQYFKSLYMQSELARFSRLLLYVGIPAVGGGILLLVTYAGVLEPSFGNTLTVLVPIVVTLSFAPLALVFAFVLRVSVVAQRTMATTPFTVAPEEKEIVNEE